MSETHPKPEYDPTILEPVAELIAACRYDVLIADNGTDSLQFLRTYKKCRIPKSCSSVMYFPSADTYINTDEAIKEAVDIPIIGGKQEVFPQNTMVLRKEGKQDIALAYGDIKKESVALLQDRYGFGTTAPLVYYDPRPGYTDDFISSYATEQNWPNIDATDNIYDLETAFRYFELPKWKQRIVTIGSVIMQSFKGHIKLQPQRK